MGAFWLARKIGVPLWAAGMVGGLIGDVAVYADSGFILANALINAPTPQYSFSGYLTVIYGAYLPTQLSIAIAEMVITGLALHYIYRQRPEVLVDLGLAENISARPGKPIEITLKSLFLAIMLLIMSTDHAVAANGAEEMKRPNNSIQMQDSTAPDSFTGMDEAVNEKLAENAGLKPKDPLINTESMGDLWNFLLLITGGVCGFILGPFTFYQEGLNLGLAAAARVACDMSWMACVFLTTPFGNLLKALKWFRVPAILLEAIAMGYRYMSLIMQDVTIKLEKEAMFVHQFMHAFAMVLCVWCKECAHPEPCRFPLMARPSMDAYGIDIGKTVEKLGLKVEFDNKGELLPCWYSMVLLD